MQDSNLIFIISQPRAGSTLLQKVISNHPEVATTSEPWFLLPLLGAHRTDLQRAKYNSSIATKAINEFLAATSGHSFYKSSLQEMILKNYAHAKGECRFFLDKTPRYYEILDELLSFFPEAHYIFLKRNPFAVLYSILSRIEREQGYISLADTLGWHRDIVLAPEVLLNFSKRKIDNLYILPYEDFTANPSKYIDELYDFIGLECNENQETIKLNNNLKGSVGDDAKATAFVRGEEYATGISSSSNDLWRSVLTKKQRFSELFISYSAFLGHDLLKELGYAAIHEHDRISSEWMKELIKAAEPSYTEVGVRKHIQWKLQGLFQFSRLNKK